MCTSKLQNYKNLKGLLSQHEQCGLADEVIDELEKALTEIAKLPEVRQDEGQYIACKALGVV